MVALMIQSQGLPKVVIDARMVGPIPHGIARYVTELAKGLKKLNDTVPLPYHPVFLTHGSEAGPEIQSFETLSTQISFLNWREIIEIPVLLKKVRAGAYHSPSFSSLWSCPCPSVITVHDL